MGGCSRLVATSFVRSQPKSGLYRGRFVKNLKNYASGSLSRGQPLRKISR